MNEFQRKITLRVFGGHVLFIVVFFLLIPGIRGCFKPKPREIVTFIDFGAPAPQVSVEQVASMAEPAPEPEPPAPEPESAPIPEPVKKKTVVKPKPKPPEKKPDPKPAPPKKSTWKPVDPKDIKIGKKVNDQPAKPTLSSSEISRSLSGISSGRTGDPSRFNDFYARVISLFYNNWTPPATASSATGSTIVRISIRKNGQITKRAKIKGSGDPLYDRTVMDAVNKVSTIPRPPADYPYDYVEVTFVLDN